MKVKVERVSLMADGSTFCRPTEGHEQLWTEIDLSEFVVIESSLDELKDSDLIWPKGAPLPGYAKVDDRLYRRK